MSDEMPGRVAVLGATGFLGSRVVEALAAAGCPVTAAARTPGAAAPGVRPVAADIRDRASVGRALAGAAAVVNCVGLYRQRRGQSFENIHVEGARRVADSAASLGLARLVHVSGIGADPASSDAYVRARGRGEAAVREAFPAAAIVRPSAMFARSGGFLADLGAVVGRAPVMPLFGRGETRLQPVHVVDVAEALARLALGRGDGGGDGWPVYELGGPEVYAYNELVLRLARRAGRTPRILPVPFAAWDALAFCLAPLPAAPLTRAQVALMRHDNVVGRGVGTFADLGIAPRSASALGLL